jgi:hypothetical protein
MTSLFVLSGGIVGALGGTWVGAVSIGVAALSTAVELYWNNREINRAMAATTRGARQR